MTIEERLLHFSPEAPLRGWRLFRVREDDAGLLLSSPMYHDPDPPAWPLAVSIATCYQGHQAPAAACRCGIYAAIRGTLDSLPGYLLDTAHDRDPWAYAEVACSGRVFVDMRGVRAERGEVVQIALGEHGWRSERGLAEAKRALAARYGVAVVDAAEIPDWVIGNLRNQGPPPADTMLDLDALGLESSPEHRRG